MVPGAQLGWEGTLAFNLDDPNQLELLSRLNQRRIEKYGMDDRRYIPVSVSQNGKIEGAVMVTDLPQGDTRLRRLRTRTPSSQVAIPHVEVNSPSGNCESKPEPDIRDNAEESVVEVVGGKVDKVVDASEEVEGEGDSFKDDRNRTTDVDGVGSTQGEEMVRLTALHDILKTQTAS